jgi:hypothetical protein
MPYELAGRRSASHIAHGNPRAAAPQPRPHAPRPGRPPQFVNAGGGYCDGGEHHDDLLFFVNAGWVAAKGNQTGAGAAGKPGKPGGAPPPSPPQQGAAAAALPHQQQQQQQQQQRPAAAVASGAGAPQAAPREPYFVRRRGASLPEDLSLSGHGFAGVDWAASVLLNTVLQSRFQLTVVACG